MPYTGQAKFLEVACGGGLLLDHSSKDMPYGAATTLQNYEANIAGGYRRMSGFAKYDSTALTGSGQVLGITTLGTNVIACRGANVEYGSGSGWTSITTGRTSTGRYHFDKFNLTGTEKIIMASGTTGTNPAATWDGSTYTLMNGALGSGEGTAPTNPTDVVEHKDHFFYLQGNTITVSAPFVPNDFDPANGAMEFIVPDTGVKLKSFRDELYIFCAKSIYKLIGDNRENFAIKDVADDIGCVSGWTIQEVGGDLIFLSPDGLRPVSGTARIDDINLSSISKQVQERIRGLDESNYVFSSNLIRNKSQYRLWWSARDDAASGISLLEANSPGLIAVLKGAAGAEGTGWEYSDMKGIKPSYAASDYISGAETVLHGGFSDGFVYKQENSVTGIGFGGGTIPSVWRSSDIIMQDSGIRKRPKHITLNVEWEGYVAPSLDVEYDFGNTAIAQPASYTITTPTHISTYGFSSTTYGGVSVYSLDPMGLDRMWVEGSGFAVALKITDTSTNSAFTILGFQIEYTEGGRK